MADAISWAEHLAALELAELTLWQQDVRPQSFDVARRMRDAYGLAASSPLLLNYFLRGLQTATYTIAATIVDGSEQELFGLDEDKSRELALRFTQVWSMMVIELGSSIPDEVLLGTARFVKVLEPLPDADALNWDSVRPPDELMASYESEIREGARTEPPGLVAEFDRMTARQRVENQNGLLAFTELAATLMLIDIVREWPGQDPLMVLALDALRDIVQCYKFFGLPAHFRNRP